MTLQSSGPISLNDVNVELGFSGTVSISLNDTAVRTLFGVASGQISMSDGYGKSNIKYWIQATTSYSVNNEYAFIEPNTFYINNSKNNLINNCLTSNKTLCLVARYDPVSPTIYNMGLYRFDADGNVVYRRNYFGATGGNPSFKILSNGFNQDKSYSIAAVGANGSAFLRYTFPSNQSSNSSLSGTLMSQSAHPGLAYYALYPASSVGENFFYQVMYARESVFNGKSFEFYNRLGVTKRTQDQMNFTWFNAQTNFEGNRAISTNAVPNGCCVDTDYNFYILHNWAYSSTVRSSYPGTYLSKFNTSGTLIFNIAINRSSSVIPPSTHNECTDVVVDSSGNIYVATKVSYNGGAIGIMKFNSSGTFVQKVNYPAVDVAPFESGLKIALTPDQSKVILGHTLGILVANTSDLSVHSCTRIISNLTNNASFYTIDTDGTSVWTSAAFLNGTGSPPTAGYGYVAKFPVSGFSSSPGTKTLSFWNSTNRSIQILRNTTATASSVAQDVTGMNTTNTWASQSTSSGLTSTSGYQSSQIDTSIPDYHMSNPVTL